MQERRNLPAELKEERTGMGWPCPEPTPVTSAVQHQPSAWPVAKLGPGVSTSPAQFPALPSNRQKEWSKPQQKNKNSHCRKQLRSGGSCPPRLGRGDAEEHS